MCLIAIAFRAHPRYPLIVAANRDEFYHRPSAPIGFWKDHPDVLAGRDLQANGTWLGISRTGRISAVTNYRDPAAIRPDALSRGRLVSDFLTSDLPPETYLTAIQNQKDQYTGFNLVVGDVTKLWWYSNKKNVVVELDPGIHAISNRLLDTPWPKTEKIRAGMETICRTKKPVDPETVFALLSDTTRAPDSELPDTGVGLDWERMLSPIFVVSDVYGTRSSAVILVENSGRVLFSERTFLPGPDFPVPENTRAFSITVPMA